MQTLLQLRGKVGGGGAEGKHGGQGRASHRQRLSQSGFDTCKSNGINTFILIAAQAGFSP
jgi:hypothetical protein